MSIFKKKIKFNQFVADVIYDYMNFLDSNIDKMIPLADEYKSLSEKDTEKLKDSAYSLVINDIMISIGEHLGNKISSENIGYIVGYLYVKYLKEVKHLDENDIKNKTSEFEILFTNLESKVNKSGKDKELKFVLCHTFAEIYSSENLTDETVKGKNFAAFKLAKSLIKADFVKLMLNEYSVDFN